MAEIIKRGRVPSKKVRITCTTCASVVEYTDADIHTTGRPMDQDEGYLECPVCFKHMSTLTVKWETIERNRGEG